MFFLDFLSNSKHGWEENASILHPLKIGIEWYWWPTEWTEMVMSINDTKKGIFVRMSIPTYFITGIVSTKTIQSSSTQCEVRQQFSVVSSCRNNGTICNYWQYSSMKASIIFKHKSLQEMNCAIFVAIEKI